MDKTALLFAFGTAALLSLGQFMFKAGANQLSYQSVPQFTLAVVTNPILVAAVALYGFTILLWIYTLHRLPLSVAYPITGIAYIIVPILGAFIFHEKISLHTVAGGSLILGGIYLCSLTE